MSSLSITLLFLWTLPLLASFSQGSKVSSQESKDQTQ